MQDIDLKKLKDTARYFRKEILEMITEAGSGHPGGSFGESGPPEELLKKYHLKDVDIVNAVKKVIKRK